MYWVHALAHTGFPVSIVYQNLAMDVPIPALRLQWKEVLPRLQTVPPHTSYPKSTYHLSKDSTILQNTFPGPRFYPD